MNPSASGGTDFAAALIPGEWEHRFVSAGGSRFHLAQTGPPGIENRLVVLLHGFPQFWWAWRRQLVDLGEAGYRTVAMDLRGYAASDKPPRGHTLLDLAADVAAVIGSLGAKRAVVVGHGLGGMVAWTMTATHPDVLAAVGVVGAIHPGARRFRSALLGTPLAAAQMLLLSAPVVAERAVERGDLVGHLLRTWSGQGWPSEAEASVYRDLMRVPFAAGKALEQVRWAIGLVAGSRRRRFGALFGVSPTCPVLHVHGAADHLLRVQAVAAPRLGGPAYEYRVVPGAGHFPPEEAPAACSELLLEWLARTSPA
jgi:pimeloyl-ACP methyl ester carboxylesterase